MTNGRDAGPRTAGAPRRLLRRNRRNGQRLAVAAAWRRALEIDALWVTLLILVGVWVMAPPGTLLRTSLQEGAIASRDYLATRDVLVLDEVASSELERRARAGVRPLYDIDAVQADDFGERIARLLEIELGLEEELRGLPAEEVAVERMRRLQVGSGLRVDEAHADLLAARAEDADQAAELEERLTGMATQLLEEGIVGNKETLLQNRLEGVTLRDLQTGEESVQLDLFGYRGYPLEVEAWLEAEVGRWAGWSRAERDTVVDFLIVNLAPNVYLNLNETQERRNTAAENVGPVFNQVRAGQVIVRMGDEVDAEALRVLGEMGGNQSRASLLRSPLGSAMASGFAATFLWIAFRRRRLVAVDGGDFGGVVLLLVLGLCAARVGFLIADALAASFPVETLSSAGSYVFGIPFAGLALLVSVLYGRGAGLLAGIAFSVLVGRLGWLASGAVATGLAGGTMIYCLVGSLAAVLALARLKQRSAVTRAGLLVGLVNVASVTLLTLLAPNDASLLTWGLGVLCGFLGGLMVAAAVSFGVPVFEAVLFRTTDIKLVELTDTEQPLLQRLALEAPGTFQHSVMVGQLARACCEAVGGNPTLAYVGGLYHDIGKLVRPHYFVENQRKGVNPHDDLMPATSARVILEHVHEGVRMAREQGLPQPIIDAIEQHHGTRRLDYFLARARRRAGSEEEVDESQFCYSGPRPQNKTMAALMLADSVEAASRTLETYTEVSIGKLVGRLFQDALENDQLSKTDLTLADLDRMRATLESMLRTVHHRRMDYPGFDFDAGERAAGLRVLPGGAAPASGSGD